MCWMYCGGCSDRGPRASEQQIDSDIDDQFAFHLAQSECEFIEKGASPDEARQSALARFGDVQRFKRQCRRVAGEERLMLQGINLVMMIVVLLAVIGVSVQVLVTRRYNTLAIQDIVSQLGEMRLHREAAARAENQPRVLVQGDVENPGWHTITFDPPTFLHDIVQQAGIKSNKQVSVSGLGGWFSSEDLLRDEPETKVVLEPGAEIYVRPAASGGEPNNRISAQEIPSGMWREVTEDGQPVASGVTFRLLASDHIENRQSFPAGSLTLPGSKETLTVMLTGDSPSDETNLRLISSLSASRHQGQKILGKWEYEQDQLIFWMPNEPVQRDEVLRLKQIEE